MAFGTYQLSAGELRSDEARSARGVYGWEPDLFRLGAGNSLCTWLAHLFNLGELLLGYWPQAFTLGLITLIRKDGSATNGQSQYSLLLFAFGGTREAMAWQASWLDDAVFWVSQQIELSRGLVRC